MAFWRIFNGTTSPFASNVLRLGSGTIAAPRSSPPPFHDLVLYEYEASPWARLVREHLTLLDLDVEVRPCPRQTLLREGVHTSESRFRGEAASWCEKVNQDLQFPLLVDSTLLKTRDQAAEEVILLESRLIIEHLWEQYGQSVLSASVALAESSAYTPRRRQADKLLYSGALPFALRFALLAGPSALRPLPSCGLMRTPSCWEKNESVPLVLYQYEGDPGSRIVREALSTLEIPYRLKAAGSCSIKAEVEKNRITIGGESHQLPVLIDPNVATTHSNVLGTVISGSNSAIAHLFTNYAIGSSLPLWNKIPADECQTCSTKSFFMNAHGAILAGRDGFVTEKTLKHWLSI